MITWRWIRRLLPAAAVVLGSPPAAALADKAQPVSPQSVPPHAAPQAWMDYAALVSTQVQARLGGDGPRAVRLRAYVGQIPGPDASSGVTLRAAFWIDEAGRITRLDLPPFAHAEPDEDLRGLLAGYQLPQAPPKGMLLPLRLALHVEPKDDQPAASAAQP